MSAPKILTLDKPCIDHGYKGNGQGYAGVDTGAIYQITSGRTYQ